MSTADRIKIERIDPFADLRDKPNVVVASLPKTTATMHIPTSQGISIGWFLFWRSLWWTIRRRKSIEFYMTGEE